MPKERSSRPDERTGVSDVDIEEYQFFVSMACEHAFLGWGTPLMFTSFRLMSTRRSLFRARLAEASIRIQ
jgi:hypothetical protein